MLRMIDYVKYLKISHPTNLLLIYKDALPS